MITIKPLELFLKTFKNNRSTGGTFSLKHVCFYDSLCNINEEIIYETVTSTEEVITRTHVINSGTYTIDNLITLFNEKVILLLMYCGG